MDEYLDNEFEDTFYEDDPAPYSDSPDVDTFYEDDIDDILDNFPISQEIDGKIITFENADMEDFAMQVAEKITEALPSEYEEAIITMHMVHKPYESYVALTAQTAEDLQNGRPLAAVNLNRLYYLYCEERAMHNPRAFEWCLRDAAKTITERPANALSESDLQKLLSDYSKVKGRLFVKLIDAKSNADLLEQIPSRQLCGMAVTYHLYLGKDDMGISSTTINNELLSQWNISLDTLHKDATSNAEKIFPAYVNVFSPTALLFDSLEDLAGGNFDKQVECLSDETAGMIILSNSRSTFGAASLVYPEVLDKITDKLQDGFYIIPSSVHELILLPDRTFGNRGFISTELDSWIAEVNRQEVLPNEILGWESLHYDKERRVLEKGLDYNKLRIEKLQKKNLKKVGNVIKEARKSYRSPDLGAR